MLSVGAGADNELGVGESALEGMKTGASGFSSTLDTLLPVKLSVGLTVLRLSLVNSMRLVAEIIALQCRKEGSVQH